MTLFNQLAIIVSLAAFLGIIMDRLKQPAILGYIIAGLAASAYGITHHQTGEVITVFGEMGVTLLLFLVGMELSWPKLKAVGKASLYVGMGQIVFTFIGGWFLASVLNFNPIESAYIAAALTFSSTIIVIKLLGEKNSLQSLQGRIAIGILLIQDFAAILVLVFLTGLSANNISPLLVIELLGKFTLLIVAIIVITKYVVPPMVLKIAHSTELLFLASLAWGLGLAALLASKPFGFSIEVGGFVAGITLANAVEQHQILSRLRPLRDFFIMLFFVSLGAGISFSGISQNLSRVAIFSLFVLIGNPIIVLAIMHLLKYRARTSFMTSLTMAQISEFSLILSWLGLKLGHIDAQIVGIITLVGVVTMTMSTYMIMRSEFIWKRVKHILKKLELPGSRNRYINKEQEWKNHIIMIGCHRTGWTIWRRLNSRGETVVVIDFNPDNVRELQKSGAQVVYGDLEDVDNLDIAQIQKAKMVISTVIDYEATLMLLEHIRTHILNKKPTVIVTAGYQHEMVKFYELGADYVIIPKEVAGVQLSDLIIKSIRKGKEVIIKQARKDRKYLR